jgi:hypothetical protein
MLPIDGPEDVRPRVGPIADLFVVEEAELEAGWAPAGAAVRLSVVQNWKREERPAGLTLRSHVCQATG